LNFQTKINMPCNCELLAKCKVTLKDQNNVYDAFKLKNPGGFEYFKVFESEDPKVYTIRTEKNLNIINSETIPV